MDADDVGVPVELHVYDLTKGLARMLSQSLLGKQLEGIWHTGVVVYGREYYYGSAGVESCRPGGTILGDPDCVLPLGDTHVPYAVYVDYILSLREGPFRPASYDLLKHNCNSFSEEVATFLCGNGIPKYILDLPEEILNTPLGQTLQPLLGLSLDPLSSAQQAHNPLLAGRDSSPSQSAPRREESPELAQLTAQIEEIRRSSAALQERRLSLNEKLLRSDKKKKKKDKKRRKEHRGSMAETGESAELEAASVAAAGAAAEEGGGRDGGGTAASAKDALAAVEQEEEEERQREQELKKQREPPIVFREGLDLAGELDTLQRLTEGRLNAEEAQSLRELRQYALEGEGSWALGDYFLNFVGRLLQDLQLGPEVRVSFLRAMAALAATRDDVILLLHQDRREHVLMSYASECDRLPLEEQEALALLATNLFENLSTSEWLLYISEWPSPAQGPRPLSNIRVTTKLAVHALLADSPRLQDLGSALLYNLAAKEVFDDVATELAMAILQFFNGSPSEEQVWRCLKALLRFCQLAHSEVPPLVKMIGPDPSKFKGTSPRVDELVDQTCALLATARSFE